MALSVGTAQRFDFSKPSPQLNSMGHKFVLAPITFDNSYAHGGESLTASAMGLTEIYSVEIAPIDGYTFEWDSTNSKVIVYKGGPGLATTITDDDSAASTGTALHVCSTADADNLTTYLTSVLANNADVEVRFGVNGGVCIVDDNNSAASVATDLYYDESEGKFLTVHALNHDTVVHLSNGDAITIFDDNSAASNGVAVYCDDNATYDYLKLFIVATANANLTFRVNEVEGGANLSAVIATARVYGA